MANGFRSVREGPSSRHAVTQKADLEAARLRVDAAAAGGHGFELDLGDHIGPQPCAMFQESPAEPVPMRFQRLLDEVAGMTQPDDNRPAGGNG